MNNQNLNNYIKSVINISFLTNKYINDEEPWKIKKTKKQSFHKMKEKCPNFHRIINEKISKKYSANHIKHSFYFF